MKKIYADPTLDITMEDFEKPAKALSVELDCEKNEGEKPEKEEFNDVF